MKSLTFSYLMCALNLDFVKSCSKMPESPKVVWKLPGTMEQAYKPFSNLGCTYENQSTIFSQLNAHGIYLKINSLDLVFFWGRQSIKVWHLIEKISYLSIQGKLIFSTIVKRITFNIWRVSICKIVFV